MILKVIRAVVVSLLLAVCLYLAIVWVFWSSLFRKREKLYE